ncbi:unnamed protein product [Lota lota]
MRAGTTGITTASRDSSSDYNSPLRLADARFQSGAQQEQTHLTLPSTHTGAGRTGVADGRRPAYGREHPVQGEALGVPQGAPGGAKQRPMWACSPVLPPLTSTPAT